MELKNNEWNVPTDYFEKNKKALLPVRKFPTGKWILALAAACVIGVGLFMLKGENQVQEVAKVQQEEKVREDKKGEEKVREGKNEKQNENEGKKGEEKVRDGKKGRDIAEELKE
ncbi:MAG: hypothetical protein RJA38_54, partial [Bacteroidota bacterium]